MFLQQSQIGHHKVENDVGFVSSGTYPPGFTKQLGWKNDPEKATLLKLDD